MDDTSGRLPAVRHATVLGAGVMGAQIAAHLANAGVRARLLDVTADAARAGLRRATALSPDPFFTTGTRSLVETGGFDDGLTDACGADWVIEAIVEDVPAKRALLDRVERARSASTIVSTNTSGIPIAALADGRSPEFRRHFLGTHFFNPPRYLHLLEIIPAEDTDPAVVDRIRAFAGVRLGKGTVVSNDTPGFIANRIGMYGVARVLEAVAGGMVTIAEADALTGTVLGRPRSATFRTLDVAGLDVFARVAADLASRLADSTGAAGFALPPVVGDLVSRGWLGAKSGQGFYRRESDGRILALDPSTMTYAASPKPAFAALDAVDGVDSIAARIRTLFLSKDRAGGFLRATLAPLLLYAARVAPIVASSIDDVDLAMRWGFGWELGPFETWDAIGIDSVLAACDDVEPPPLVEEARRRGGFRSASTPGAVRLLEPSGPAAATLRRSLAQKAVVRGNAAASLVDLGDGVLAVALHSKLNTIGGDTLAMLDAGVREAEANYRALVVCADAVRFSAGANLMLLLLEAQEGNWDEIDLMVRAFQGMTTKLRTAAVPVIAAPLGLALGGACEICLHASRVVASAETYLGLVEVGVGLIPAGGGTKELLARAMEAAGAGADPLPASRQVFETIGFARTSTSAPHAAEIGYLRDADPVVMNPDRLMDAAKATALSLADGYVPGELRPAIRAGGENVEAALKLGVHLAWRAGRITDHDVTIGRRLAHVIAGGLRHEGTLSEQALLDLEREAFLALCGEPKTLERIAHMLRHGKPIRN